MKTLTCLACALALLGSVAYAETLTYQASNRWVAQDDAKPLRALLAKARQGTTRFEVSLPESGRKASVERLEVLRDLLEREAKQGVVLEEVTGNPAAANTLDIVAK